MHRKSHRLPILGLHKAIARTPGKPLSIFFFRVIEIVNFSHQLGFTINENSDLLTQQLSGYYNY